MKNIFLSLNLILISTIYHAQTLSISAAIRERQSSGAYHYFASGHGVFGDSLIFNVELVNPLDSTILFSGYYDLSNPTNNTLPTFSYDSQSMEYRFDMGQFPQSNNIIHIWTNFGDKKREELIYSQN